MESDAFGSRLLLEKSNLRRTKADDEAPCDAARVGEEPRPSDGFLLAGDCKNVLIGDLERGGGIRILAPCFRAVRTEVGSGIVPEGV